MNSEPDHPQQRPSSNEGFIEKAGNWARHSVILRLITIAILVLLLLIPSGMIKQLINEREDRKDAAIEEVTSKWAEEQFISGPVLSVPFVQRVQNTNGKAYNEIHYLNITPEHLDIQSQVSPVIKKRGMFKVVLYTSDISFEGSFGQIDIGALNLDPGSLMWDKAFLAVRTDMSAIRNNVRIKFDNDSLSFRPTIPVVRGSKEGIHALVDSLNPDALVNGLNFSFTMQIKGSSMLMFSPVGKTTTASMSSSWSDPAFDGSILPDTHNVRENGFDAEWKVLEFNRRMPNAWIDNEWTFSEPDIYYDEISVGSSENAWFGLKLIIPADAYQQSMRTAKYAILLIVLTFTIFFIIEILNRKRIHPIQYVLVGLGLTLFYSLLLALAEHSSFDIAYLVASIVMVLVITLYTASIFKNTRLTILTGAVLAVLYAYIYIILQQSDYAFLLGNIGLLLALVLVMYFTRKLDWYSLGQRKK